MKKLAVGILLSIAMAAPAVYAKGISVDELQDLPEAKNLFKSDNSKTINPEHWAYKSLENISKKYGLAVGDPSEKFNINRPLTRNEAAVILVSLMGKINEDRVQLTDAEQERLSILKEELTQELAALTGRVEVLEGDVKTIKGSVAKIEQSNAKTVKFSSLAESTTLGGGFQGKYAGNFQSGSTNYPSNFGIPVGILWAKGKMAKHADYNIQILPSRFYDSSTNTFMGDAYVSTDIIPHNKVYFGQTRIPFGIEGPTVEFYLDTIDRSQIARNYAARRDMGIRADGNFKYFNYRLATYNGARGKSADTNDNMDVMGWADITPFAAHPEWGKLSFGGGYAKGVSNYNKYNTFGADASYKIGKLGLKYETMFSDGGYAANFANGIYTAKSGDIGGIKSGGCYGQVSYDLTKKVQLLARYDVFDPNRQISANDITEYTLGTNYFIKGDNLKLQLNYVYVKNQLGTNASRIVAQTTYIF